MNKRCAVPAVSPVPETATGTYHQGTRPRPDEVLGPKSPISGLLISAFGRGILPRRPGRSVSGLVLVSLLSFGVANAEFSFHAVLDQMSTVTRIDSVKLTSPDMFFPTPGWGSQTPYDTFDFAGLTAWPLSIRLFGIVNDSPVARSIYPPKTDTWYFVRFTLPSPKVMFWRDPGVEESGPAPAPLSRLTVSPSVVTAKMTVRLQPPGTGRPMVEIHDAVGKVVRSLSCTAATDGPATATWDREDDHGRLVPEGVYFCRYAAADIIAVRKVLLAH